MNELEATGVLVLLFALRCVMPALLMFGLGYLMNYLVDRWRKEDKVRRTTSKRCPAYYQFGDRCWAQRLNQEGALPVECVRCPIYTRAIQVA